MLAALALVFAALWVTGLVAPRARLSVTAGFAPSANAGVAHVEVRNYGLLPAHVVGPVHLAPAPDHGYYEPPVRLTGPAPGHRVRIEGGGSTEFYVSYAVDCDAERFRNAGRSALAPALRLRVRVEGPAGVERSFGYHELTLIGACGKTLETREG